METVDQLANDVFARAVERPGEVAFWVPDRAGHANGPAPRVRTVTAREFAERVTELAAGLIAAGVAPGDRIGLLAPPGFAWALSDYAIWTAGAVSVPVDEHDAAHVLRASRAVAIIVRDHSTAGRALCSSTGSPPATRAGLRAVWSIEDGDLERLADGGAAVPQAVVDGRRRAVRPEDPASIVNTAGHGPRDAAPRRNGSTPSPDAGPRVLSHGALRAAVWATALPRGASVLLHRPLTRPVPRLLQLSAVHHGCRIGYEPDPRALPRRIRSLGPSVLLATPRLLAELLELARAEAYADGRGALFARAEHTAVAYGRALADGGPSRWLRAERRVFDRLCYARLRGFLGGHATHLVCDGTPDEPLSAFYRGAGLTPLPVGTPAPGIGACRSALWEVAGGEVVEDALGALEDEGGDDGRA